MRDQFRKSVSMHTLSRCAAALLSCVVELVVVLRACHCTACLLCSLLVWRSPDPFPAILYCVKPYKMEAGSESGYIRLAPFLNVNFSSSRWRGSKDVIAGKEYVWLKAVNVLLTASMLQYLERCGRCLWKRRSRSEAKPCLLSSRGHPSSPSWQRDWKRHGALCCSLLQDDRQGGVAYTHYCQKCLMWVWWPISANFACATRNNFQHINEVKTCASHAFSISFCLSCFCQCVVIPTASWRLMCICVYVRTTCTL